MENKIKNEELKLQADCVLWYKNEYRKNWGKFRRVKNETDLKGKQGLLMGQLGKVTGIVAGTWDSFLLVEPIVWIEFKSERGVLSPAQIDFENMGREVGWNFVVIKSLTQFKTVIYDKLGK